MRSWRIRDFHEDDLDQVIRAWEQSRTDGVSVHGLAEVLDTLRSDELALVAVAESVVVGAAVTRIRDNRGWMVLFALADGWRGLGIGSELIHATEKRLASRGVHRLSTLLREDATGAAAFRNAAYTETQLTYFDRGPAVLPQEVDHLARVGGRILSAGRWDALAGMEPEKQLIERRLVLPLADPELAHQYGVRPPKGVVLFGPPGTGKTTFAKAVASRLGWPFVEVFPARLAAQGVSLAEGLHRTFAEIALLEHALVFMDEVEEVAGERDKNSPSPLGVTNELLKIIPTFREKEGRMLVCATNFVRALDSAFLRHGRFDYVIPIGPPDAVARQAIWRRYIPPTVFDRIDLDLLVERSECFTPADIEFAARKASQRALEKAVYGAEPVGDRSSGPTTDDYTEAIKETRATVTPEILTEFEEDIEAIARL